MSEFEGAGREGTSHRTLTLAEALPLAIAQHRQGNLEFAEDVYRVVLAAMPDHPDALHFLGMLNHQRGDSETAIELIRRAIEQAPEAVPPRNNLGTILLDLERFDEAITVYRECLAIAPDHADTHSNLGVLLKKRFGAMEEAEAAFRRAIELAPDHPAAHFNLGQLLERLGRIEEAVMHGLRAITLDPKFASARRLLGYAYHALGETEKAIAVYDEWLARDPGNEVAMHYRAAISGERPPERASDAYVEKTFDKFATSFDSKLEGLGYRAPALVADALQNRVGDPQPVFDVLDAGCGTGLCGPLLRPFARRLQGVDLSAGMLNGARSRDVYDELHKGELTAFIAGLCKALDVIVSADTLCYFGSLAEVAEAARTALRPSGVLIFSVEALADEDEEAHRLLYHGRYAHGRSYLEQVLAQAGFRDTRIASEVLRSECGKPVKGFVVSAVRP